MAERHGSCHRPVHPGRGGHADRRCDLSNKKSKTPPAATNGVLLRKKNERNVSQMGNLSTSTLCYANRVMSSSKETFRNWRTGEEVGPEDHAEYVLRKLGMRVIAEKEETQEAIDAMIEWYFSGSDWETVDTEEEELDDGYDDYIDMLINERLEAQHGAF